MTPVVSHVANFGNIIHAKNIHLSCKYMFRCTPGCFSALNSPKPSHALHSFLISYNKPFISQDPSYLDSDNLFTLDITKLKVNVRDLIVTILPCCGELFEIQ